jgi:hypothetical protein
MRAPIILLVAILAVAIGGFAIYCELDCDWFVREQIDLLDSPDANVRYTATANIGLNLSRLSFLN